MVSFLVEVWFVPQRMVVSLLSGRLGSLFTGIESVHIFSNGCMARSLVGRTVSPLMRCIGSFLLDRMWILVPW